MIRYKTNATKDLFHIVPMALMDAVQASYLASKGINKAYVMKTYKTLKGAQKAVKAGYVIVWEKAF